MICFCYFWNMGGVVHFLNISEYQPIIYLFKNLKIQTNITNQYYKPIDFVKMKRKAETDHETNKKQKLQLDNTSVQELYSPQGFSLSLLLSSPNFTKEPFIINGKIFEGVETLYFNDGRVKSTCEYKNFKKNGFYKEYAKKLRTNDGNVVRRIVVHKRDNLASFFDKISEHDEIFLKKKSHYKDGKLHGEYFIYNEDGTLNVECKYVDGKIDGKYLFRDGRFERNYKNGLNHGLCMYYSDGVILKENYENGVLHGKYSQTFRDGSPHITKEYKNGKMDGKCVEYWDNRKIRHIKEYSNGKQHGEYTLYYKNGKVRTKGTYANGKKIS